MEILLASLFSLAALGLLFGLGLAFASKKLAVPKDPLVESVEGKLPGANCGACGYAGCSAFAKAVVAGKAPLSACTVSDDESLKEIAEMTGQTVEKQLALVAQLICNGNRDHGKFVAEYEGLENCHAAIMIGEAGKQCQFSCVGYGSCVQICPFDAMEIVNGIVEIDEEKCTGCGACVKECPRDVLELAPRDLNHVFIRCSSHDKGKTAKSACKVACIACQACYKVCPYDAISMEDNLAVVDYDKCTSCGICVNVCPTNAIHDQLAPRQFAVIKDNCIGCTMCAKVCPSNCITGERKELHVVDQANCVGCEHCYIVCPVEAVVMKPQEEFDVERPKRIKLEKIKPPKKRQRPTHWDSPGNEAVKSKKKEKKE
jgi:RnfABCDGE-type electron transport complex B subunit